MIEAFTQKYSRGSTQKPRPMVEIYRTGFLSGALLGSLSGWAPAVDPTLAILPAHGVTCGGFARMRRITGQAPTEYRGIPANESYLQYLALR
jgi:hypothetical protein